MMVAPNGTERTYSLLNSGEALHSSDIRAIKYYSTGSDEYWITASRDGSVKCWRWNYHSKKVALDTQDVFQAVGSCEEHAGFVNALAITPSSYLQSENSFLNEEEEGSMNDFIVASGGVDKIVNLWSPQQNGILAVLVGHTGNICDLEFIPQAKTLISSSWDGTARVWKGRECSMTLKGHEGAVWVTVAVDGGRMFLTGSADKCIRLWTEEGRCTSIFTGHEGAVRAICLMPSSHHWADFLSAGNDGKIKFWKFSGNCVLTLDAHDNFIYTMAIHEGYLFSAGEDRQIKIWKMAEREVQCIQSISMPADSIWSLAVSQRGEVAAACSTGSFYIFSPSKSASPALIEAFRAKVAQQQLPKQLVENLESTALSQPGRKVGETKLVSLPQGATEVFQWNGTTWEKIGNVVDNPANNTKTTFQGKQYDYVFDVELESGGPTCKLPFNRGDNPYAVASKFLADNNLGGEMLNQVVEFLLRNTEETLQISHAAPLGDPYHTESTETSKDQLLIQEFNVAGIAKKMKEFQEAENGDEAVSKLIDQVQHQSFSPSSIKTILHLLHSWDVMHRFPRTTNHLLRGFFLIIVITL